MRLFNIIAAVDPNLGIGNLNILPWHYSEDLKFFKKMTLNNIIIMGRHTWESLLRKPLPERHNIVISSQNISNIETHTTLYNAIQSLDNDDIRDIFIIGGAQLYKEAIQNIYCRKLYITEIHKEYVCDCFFPNFKKYFKEIKRDNREEYDFVIYERENKEEKEYLNLIHNIIKMGNIKDDRTDIGTLSLFGTSLRFDLSRGFPLLTTKKVYWKGIVEELLWFISGNTNSKKLEAKNVKIWKGNTTRDFLDSRNLSYQEGDIGPMYGFQWRHWGAEYNGCDSNYSEKGYDQLQRLIIDLKNDPDSRRHILSAWNPPTIKESVLAPCHIICQFYIHENKLSCQMYQRSADMGLGVPFNIASYSLLTHLIAEIIDCKVGEFIHIMGDCHVYNTHIAPLLEQLKRIPKPFPILKVNHRDNIDNFIFSDFELLDYNPYPSIKMDMSI